MNVLLHNLRRSRRAVSPVIAVILLIALTVGAVGVIYAVVNSLTTLPAGTLFVQGTGVADKNSNSIGDYIQILVKDVGGDVVINNATLTRDGTTLTSWGLVNGSVTISTSQLGYINLQTTNKFDEVSASNSVVVYLNGPGFIGLQVNVTVPPVLSSLPVIFQSNNFSNININSGGWTQYTYNTHGGGTGIYVQGGDILFDTNNDILLYLKNSTDTVQNGIISSTFMYGDNDGIGIAFRITDAQNYYWVGITNDHNGPNNRAGETSSNFHGPYFTYDYRFEMHKLVNGVDTILANATPSFAFVSGTSSNPTGPYYFKVSFSGSSLAFQAGTSSANLQELFTVQDSTFSNAGYFGVFSLAAQSSRLNSFTVTV